LACFRNSHHQKPEEGDSRDAEYNAVQYKQCIELD
jgi:hypothetical protein